MRKLYEDCPDLVENGEIIRRFADDVLSIVRTGNDIRMADRSYLIFEAVVENADTKIDILKRLKERGRPEAYFFSNTSSIPIKVLNEGAGLEGRIVGFHFYNPPRVQKFVELISTEETRQDLLEAAGELHG